MVLLRALLSQRGDGSDTMPLCPFLMKSLSVAEPISSPTDAARNKLGF